MVRTPHKGETAQNDANANSPVYHYTQKLSKSNKWKVLFAKKKQIS